MQGILTTIARYWPVLIPILLPYLVALISRCEWSSTAKGWVAFAVCVAAGVIGALVAGIPLASATFTTWAAAVIAGTQVAYLVFRSNHITSSWLDALLAVGSSLKS